MVNNTENSLTKTYQQEEVQQILQIAIARKHDLGELTRAEVLEIATEIGVSPDDLWAAEAEWLNRSQDLQEKLIFNQARRERLRKDLIRYGIVNGFLILLNLAITHSLSWCLPILILWGLGLALNIWKTSQTEGDEYEQAFQRWRLKKQVGQTLTNLTGKVLKTLNS